MSLVTPIRAGDTLADHAEYIARYCRALAVSAEFKSAMASSRAHLTQTHIELHSARLSIARAKDAVDAIASAADAYVKEPACS